MPASSKAQQRFFGVVKAMQKGDLPKTGKAGKIAKTMDKDDVDDFASTKHKGKPEKVKREMRVRELIKKMVREELAEMNEGKYDRELISLDNATAKEFGSWKSEVLKLSKLLPNSEKKKINKDIMTINKLVFNITKTFDKNLDEGTCGYGENGELGEEPAGPHLIKKNKNKIEEIGFLAKQVAKIVVPMVRKVIGSELEMDDVNEGKDTIFDVAKKVMKDSSAYKYKSKRGMVMVDMQTANLLTQVFKKINPKMKKILSDLGEKNPAQLVATLQAVVK